MKLRSIVASALLAAGAIAIPSLGQARIVEFDVTVAPPPPPAGVIVTTPEARAGFLYEPGHYSYDGSRFVWTDPQYIREREGHVYSPYVLERRGEKWHYRGGHWDDD